MKKVRRMFGALLCVTMLASMFGVFGFTVSALPNAVTVIDYPKLAEGYNISIDGVIDPNEGWGEPLVFINGTNIQNGYSTKPTFTDWDTISIKGYYRWDEECLYFACQVVEPEHYNPFVDGESWKGDSIRFDISHDVNGNQAALDKTMKYWFYLNGDNWKSGLYQEKAEDGCYKTSGEVASKSFKVIRDEDNMTTTYELAMLWKENLPYGTKVEEGFQLVAHQRVMERSKSDSEPLNSISLPGYDSKQGTSKWHYVTLSAAVDEAKEPCQHDMALESVIRENNCTKSGAGIYKCTLCGYTKEDVIPSLGGHTYSNDCDEICNVCEKPRTVGPHTYDDDCDAYCNSCDAPRTITHAYDDATCTAPKTCKVCGDTEGKANGHDYAAATCTAPKTCKVCKATSGKALGHDYKAATCTAPKTCKVCKATSGKALGHDYEKVTVKATLTKNGKIKNVCEKCGYTASKYTTIRYAKTVKLSATSYTYNGKAKKPSVTVKDSAGKTISTKYYTVTYASGRKNVGTYKVTVKFKGRYSGTKTLTFKINPAKTTVKSLTAGKKSLKVAITKKSSQVTGYEVQYSTSKKFTSAKTKTIKSYKTTSLTVKSLSAKKTYYVRVRTYKTVNGKKYYSGWSTAKSVKTK